MVFTRSSVAAEKKLEGCAATLKAAPSSAAKKATKKSQTAKTSKPKNSVDPSARKISPASRKKKDKTTPEKRIFATELCRDLPLLSLEDLLPVTLVNRPSKRNRSPYVADVSVAAQEEEEAANTADSAREAICHVPNLDMGGKCSPGATLLVKRARDKKGNILGPNAVNPKYGTPKCEFIAQLLRVDETALGYKPAAWVGAHPSLGEKIAEQLLLRNALQPQLPKIKSIQREVRNVAGADMRADFVVHFEDTSLKPCVLEVKTVVDTDYAPDRTPTQRTKCVFVNHITPYRRAGIFPWGQSNQKGPNGETVVSARSIKHVRELTRMAQGDLVGASGELYQAAVLFVVIRRDADYFRPNHEACPSFSKYLRQAQEAGVMLLAKRVDWGDTPETLGQCQEGPLLEIEWPDLQETR
ncbi:Sugar fermentation stimulation protein homolog [Seminavis robusta]|uniref:Sugar fermentation stimulation protein homolog n=1 Tax=Seminavis robusta TaxID=568900 RepID=A0A9N8HC40_9STRA|nr:Sugar fermentation stimulation protein homolog [Seminavis robusta]|eukprot:Sro391_g133040.1 Sugar fermentation stimulation protein homolog (413) ;mRNA; r:10795-12033